MGFQCSSDAQAYVIGQRILAKQSWKKIADRLVDDFCPNLCSRHENGCQNKHNPADCDQLPGSDSTSTMKRIVAAYNKNPEAEENRWLMKKARDLLGLESEEAPAVGKPHVEAPVSAGAKRQHVRRISEQLEKLRQQYSTTASPIEVGATLYQALSLEKLPWVTDKEEELFPGKTDKKRKKKPPKVVTGLKGRFEVMTDEYTPSRFDLETTLFSFSEWVEANQLFLEAADSHFPEVKEAYLRFRETAIKQFVNKEKYQGGTFQDFTPYQEALERLNYAIEKALDIGNFPGVCPRCPK